MDSIVDASNIICESADAEQYTELVSIILHIYE